MKKIILIGTIAFVTGLFLMGASMYKAAPGLMLLEDKSPYSFEEAVALFEKNTLESGWKIPAIHDLQETMNNFGKDVRQAKVFELCHPEHAYKILRESDERVVSALMPCRVSIYEKEDGSVHVSRLNAGLMGKMMMGVVPEVMDVAARESEELVSSILTR